MKRLLKDLIQSLPFLIISSVIVVLFRKLTKLEAESPMLDFFIDAFAIGLLSFIIQSFLKNKM